MAGKGLAMLSELYITEIRKRDVDKRDSSSADFSQERESALDYPFSIPAIKNLKRLKLESNVTFFVGENGTGKSTLLEAIAVNYGFNAEGGSKNFNFSTMATHSNLHEHIVVAKGVRRAKDGYFLRAESFYNVATEVDRLRVGGYGGKSLHAQSHGESFLSLVMNRFSGEGLYLLDEPESALSPARQLALLSRMRDLEKAKAQFIIATHSPILLAYPNAQIYVLGDGEITLTPYKETEHYVITRQFLNNPEGVMGHLF